VPDTPENATVQALLEHPVPDNQPVSVSYAYLIPKPAPLENPYLNAQVELVSYLA